MGSWIRPRKFYGWRYRLRSYVLRVKAECTTIVLSANGCARLSEPPAVFPCRQIKSEGRQSIECLRVNEGVRVFPRRQTVFPVGQKKNEREVVICMNGGR